MNGPRKFLLIVASIFTFTPLMFSSATNIYITPDGSPQGSCTSNTQNPAWFNNASNWGSGNTQIGPGTTVLLCGTFTGTAGQQLLTVRGSGSSGSPILIQFDTGTVLTAPYWSNTGAIGASGVSWITIDGGSGGTIQDTANGTTLKYQQPSTAINALPCNNCEFRNLSIVNLYIHSGSACEIDQTQVNAIKFSGQNVLVHDNSIHDVGWSIWDDYGNNDTNHQIYNNDVWHSDHTIIFAGNGLTGVNLDEQIYNNHVHDFSNWDTTANCYHHDGLHAFGSPASPLVNLYVYNNQCDGSLGNNFNACWFMEGGIEGTPWSGNPNSYFAFFNNVGVTNNAHDLVEGGGFTGASGNNTLIANNTMVGSGNSGDVAFDTNGTNVLFKNNAMTALGYYVQLNGFTVANPSTDFVSNVYAACAGYNCFNWTPIDTSGFSTWQSSCKCDSSNNMPASNSSYQASLNLNTTYAPNSGSPVIGAGVNLTSLCAGSLVALCSDKNGTPRPTTGAWDVGAYQFSSSAPPSPPTGLSAVIQ